MSKNISLYLVIAVLLVGLLSYPHVVSNAQTLPVPTVAQPTVTVTVPTVEPTPALPTFVDFMETAKQEARNDPTLSVIVWLKSDAWFPVEEITRTGADWVCYRSVSSRGALIAETCVMTSEIARMTFDRPSIEPTAAQIGG